MKNRPLMVLLVVISVLAIMPTTAMAFSGSSGEPGANCPEPDEAPVPFKRYTYAAPPWLGTLTLKCINADSNPAECDSILFEGAVSQGSGAEVIFMDEEWGTLPVAEFNAITARGLAGTCVQQSPIVDKFIDTGNFYFFVEILGAHGLQSVGSAEEPAYSFDAIVMGLVTVPY